MKILVLYLVGGPLKQLHMLIGTITSAFAKASLQQCSVDEREHLSLSAKRVPKQDQCGTTAGQTVSYRFHSRWYSTAPPCKLSELYHRSSDSDGLIFYHSKPTNVVECFLE